MLDKIQNFDILHPGVDIAHKGKYDNLHPGVDTSHEGQALLNLSKFMQVEILTSECLRKNPAQFIDSKHDELLDKISGAPREKLNAWINNCTKEEVREHPAFYNRVMKELRKWDKHL